MRVVIVVLLSIVLTGCRSGELPADSAPPQAAGLATGASSPSPESGTTSALGAHDLDGVSVELVGVDIGPADTIQVRWRYRNDTAEERVLAGGVDRPDAELLLTAEAFLVDDLHQKKYRVVVDANDQPVASRHGGPNWVAIGAGETINAWAKFPAPAEGTTQISVHVPGVPPFEDVKLSTPPPSEP